MNRAFQLILLLYLLTWIPAVPMIRKARPAHHPRVFPVLPFLVLSCDTSALAGEWTLYLSCGVAVTPVHTIRFWIAVKP